MISTRIRRLGTAAAAVVLFTGWSSAAWAATTISLRGAHVGATAGGFGERQCTGPFANLPANLDGWHFVLPSSVADNFESITLAFTPGGAVGPIVSRDPNAPSSGAGWTGFIDEAGNSGDFRHAYVFTTAGWTLTGGTAVVTPDTATTEVFNLSHVCPGNRPSGSPTPSPSTSTSTTPSTSTTASPRVVPSGAADTGGGLRSSSVTIGGAALVIAILGGLGLTIAHRRRDLG